MKVFLLKNAKGLGNAGQLVDVAQGYAINKLIPQGIGKIPTLSEEAASKNFVPDTKESPEFIEWAKMAIAKIGGKTLLFSEKASEKGHLFGSITEKNIVDRIKSDMQIEVKESQIDMPKHIKDLGDNRVEVVLSPEYHAAFTIRVEAAK